MGFWDSIWETIQNVGNNLAISGSSATGNTGLAGASESARQAKLKEEDAKKRALGVSDYKNTILKG